MLVLLAGALLSGIAVPFFIAKLLPPGLVYAALGVLTGYAVSLGMLLLLVSLAVTHRYHPGALIAVNLFGPAFAVWRARRAATSRQPPV